jgi:hypothetical protein
MHCAGDSGGRRGNTPAGDEQQKLDGARALGLLGVASHGDLSEMDFKQGSISRFLLEKPGHLLPKWYKKSLRQPVMIQILLNFDASEGNAITVLSPHVPAPLYLKFKA